MATPEERLDELARRPLAPLRGRLASGVRNALGASADELTLYARGAGDPGLFGPDSLAWRVHADLPVMLIGGFSSLIYQTLHPLAMAGVASHSRFREDPVGRLQRTARFIAGTTFGATAFAEQLIGEVRAVHLRVRGIAADGRAYAASDPELLTFVHTTEVWSFLRSYQRYAPLPLLRTEKDRYLGEVALIARRLGARDVPGSVEEVRDYLHQIEDQLAVTPEALETVAFLRRSASQDRLEVLGHDVVTAAAVDLLPPHLARQLGFSTLRRFAAPAVHRAAHGFAWSLRWSVGPSLVAQIARERAATSLVGSGAEGSVL
jgi:uncharacterized protein (DUF2236 family)